MKYTQEEQNQILRKLNTGAIGKRRQGVWDYIAAKTIWNKKSVINTAKLYKYYSKFNDDHNGAVMYATRNGFLDEATSHLIKETQWDLEKVKEVAKLYKTRRKFALSKDKNAWQWARRNKKLDEVCAHMPKHINEVSKETIYQIAKNCKNPTALFNIKNSYYRKAKKEGWLKEWFPKK